VLLVLFAAGVNLLRDPLAEAAMSGLQLAAIAVVANAVRLMHRQLSPDLSRSIFAVFTLALILRWPVSTAQIMAIILSGTAGALFLTDGRAAPLSNFFLPIRRSVAVAALFLFAFILVLVEVSSAFRSTGSMGVFRAFYQSGALVFGGGHVVLPLLQEVVVRPGWIDEADFLAGYGAAQTVPGPLFTFAAYLGYLLPSQPNKLIGALMCLIALFLPGILLVIGVAPYWQHIREQTRARSAIAGINASVVGLLAAALVKMVLTASLRNPINICLVVVAFALLWIGRIPPLPVVLGSAATMVLERLLGYAGR
jgi:chromate transporter